MKGTTMTQLTLWDTDPLLDKHQVAERLNVGVRFVERLIAEKRIAYIKVGRHVRMRASVVDAFIASNTVGSPDIGSGPLRQSAIETAALT
jgi:excisionase family DNA binding protein